METGRLLLVGSDSSATTETENINHFRFACDELVHRANTVRMNSSNSSFATKGCACASVTFLACHLPVRGVYFHNALPTTKYLYFLRSPMRATYM